MYSVVIVIEYTITLLHGPLVLAHKFLSSLLTKKMIMVALLLSFFAQVVLVKEQMGHS